LAILEILTRTKGHLQVAVVVLLMAVDAVSGELVSTVNSLVSGKFCREIPRSSAAYGRE
jgi:hypothetical protein